MTTNFYGFIYRKLIANPDRELLIWPDQSTHTDNAYTGRAILNRIATIGNELSERRIQPGQQVLLAMPVTFDLICTLLAIMALGAIPVLPPATSSPRTLLLLAIKEDVRAVVSQQRISPPFRWLAKWFGISLVDTESIAGSASAWRLPQTVDSEQPALISHSSGSTGKAKSIRRSHRVLLAQHQALGEAFPPWPGQRDFPLFPNILLHNLASGTVSILPDLPGFDVTRMQPDRIIKQLIGHRVQTLTGNVYYFRKLLRQLETQPITFPTVRAVGIGGSPVDELLAHSLKRFFVQADVYIIYGSSEAEPIAIRKIGPDRWPAHLGYGVGMIHPSIRVNIRPFGTLAFATGTSIVVGEIEVKGAHVATPKDDWLPTGDFGYLDEENGLFLTGRMGNERIHQGVQHYQVEHVLLSVAGVERVAARSTEAGFTVYIECNPAETDLRNALADHFPPGIVDRIHFRNELPVDARHHSKIRYEQVK